MSNLFGFVTAALGATFFMLFIDGGIGSLLLYVIVGSNIVSIILLLISKKRFSVELKELSGTAECGTEVEFEVVLKKTGFCFIPFVELCLMADSPIRIRTALLFKGKTSAVGKMKLSHSGLNRLRLEKVQISDFLGDLYLKVPVVSETCMAALPRIIEYDGPEIIPNTLPSEEEEVEEGVTTLAGGMPGYEHREYTPGDSPRKVNYKLSAKKSKLMVRLDESAGSAATNLYITEDAMPVCCDKALALAGRLIMRGGTVKITHKNDSLIASTPETLGKMREWLAFREFAEELSENPETSFPADATVVFSQNGVITKTAFA